MKQMQNNQASLERQRRVLTSLHTALGVLRQWFARSQLGPADNYVPR